MTPPDRRLDILSRERLKTLIDSLEEQETALVAARELVKAQAEAMAKVVKRLVWAFAVLGVMVTGALAIGGLAIARNRQLAHDQIEQRHRALVQSCEARNQQNRGIVGFLASLPSSKGRTFDDIARIPRVHKFFPIHGSNDVAQNVYCVRYAATLS